MWFGTNDPPTCKINRTVRDVLLSPMENFSVKLHLFFSILALILGFVGDYDSMKYSWIGGVSSMSLLLLVYIILLLPEFFQYLEDNELKKYAF
jgi:hypothetical protein